MGTTPEGFSNIQINDELENKPNIKISNTKDDSICISENSQITTDSQNTSIRFPRKNKNIKIKRSLTSILNLNNRKILNIENEFFPEKEDSANLLIFTKKNENEENGNENKYNKIAVAEINIETKGKKNKKDENNIKIKDVNKDNCLNTIEKYNANKNIQINIKKNTDKSGIYTQIYSRNDFCDKPPKVSRLFMDNYDYENKNIFSYSNDTNGIIKESKKIPNVFYNHLLINNENNERYINTSLNKNNNGKLLTFIFYAPRTIFV